MSNDRVPEIDFDHFDHDHFDHQSFRHKPHMEWNLAISDCKIGRVSKYRLLLPSEDDIKQYLLENIPEEKFKELKEEEESAE